MAPRILSSIELPIAGEADVIEVRRRVRALAQPRGFDAFATTAITTATSELARNAWVHAKGGTATIEELAEESRFGLRITFVDHGPGIDDVDRVLVGGYSTARSLGLGLSGTRRLVDAFDIESSPKGTRIVIVKWTRY